ncbi:MAG TPA: hypothetical protein RMH99_31025 [Sandaracinaceae bacterium LLY-WYZ-13_1]|nr:hypothetical protein [Sandaracinaceae bacterium LLY-WYZ-13_1]
MTPRSLPFALLALLGLACDPVDPAPDGGTGGPDANVDPSLELGTGEGFFQPFEDGDTLDLVSGCQGSQHVWIALRAEGIDPRGPIIDLELVRDSDGTVVSQAFTVRVSFDAVAGTPHADVYGLTLVVPEPDQAIGEDLTVRATVTDMNEVTVMDERPIRIDWGEGGCRGPAPG